MTKQFTKSGKAITNTMQEGQLAINNISQQATPGLVELLTRLGVVSSNLERLTSELESNPSILVRGRQPRAEGPGE